jgi:hypothetical protein
MPRMTAETAALLSDFTSRLNRLVAAAREEGRESALAEVRSLVGGALPAHSDPTPAATRGGRPVGKSDGRRNSWSGMTPAARLARVNAIRVGKGLPPKDRL